MIRFDHWMLPDGETHLQEWMRTMKQRREGRLTYQIRKYEAALKHCRQRRVAVDIGAHVGLWSYWMAKDFARLVAFEPKPAHRECWAVNMAFAENAELMPCALGDREGLVDLETGPSSSGDTRVVLTGNGIPMHTLDSFGLTDVDFIKIDCEGFEAFVLEGAKETIARCRPVVIVEQKPGHGQRFGRGERDAVSILQAAGARQVGEIAGDFILMFPAREPSELSKETGSSASVMN